MMLIPKVTDKGFILLVGKIFLKWKEIFNMKIKSGIYLSLIASLFIQSAYANMLPMPPKPEKCPSINAIQSVGINDFKQQNTGLWAAGVHNNPYDTNEDWTFVMGDINATGIDDVRNKVTTALSTLYFQYGPTPIPQLGVWSCLYNNAAGYLSNAFTPAFRA